MVQIPVAAMHFTLNCLAELHATQASLSLSFNGAPQLSARQWIGRRRAHDAQSGRNATLMQRSSFNEEQGMNEITDARERHTQGK